MADSSVGLVFGEVISRRTCYGLIWSGTFHQKPCVIKMVMMDSGVHFDKNKKKYRNNSSTISKNQSLSSIFEKDDPIPFLHTDFKHRRSMAMDDYLHEANEMSFLK